MPRLWVLYFRRHPLLVESARVTLTGDGHPGDPVNVALVGTEEEARIAADTVLHRPTTMRR